MSYNVGQVLFVIFKNKMQVYPMMVVEEITKRTLKGEEMSYLLQGGSDKSTTILLSQVDGEIFESSDEAKYVLVSRATSQIEKLVDDAVLKAEKWYSINSQEKEIMSLSKDDNKIISNDEINVTLPDGTIAKLKNPSMTG